MWNAEPKLCCAHVARLKVAHESDFARVKISSGAGILLILLTCYLPDPDPSFVQL
jgi:hypothetical protein